MLGHIWRDVGGGRHLESGGPGLEGQDGEGRLSAQVHTQTDIQLWHPDNIPSDEFSYLKVPPNVSLTRSSTIRPESLIFFAELQGLL